MPSRKLLENYPLYRALKLNLPLNLDDLEKPAINMYCPVCKGNETFNMANEFFEGFSHRNYALGGTVCRLRYQCSSCNRFERYFLVKFAQNAESAVKVGQYPPWDISLDASLEEMLGEHAGLYKHGLISESQGYGIGAFAYYRRIVEEIIDSLLDEVATLLGGDELAAYEEALTRAKATTVTQDKIAIVKDLLPPILRPGGANPLSVLHDTLSVGLHRRSESECLESAMAIREALVFLVSQVRMSQRSSRGFTESMRKLLEGKAKREKKVE